MNQAPLNSLMDSQGHRDTLLDPAFTHVAIGLAWNANTYKAVQQFESRISRLHTGPTLTGSNKPLI